MGGWGGARCAEIFSRQTLRSMINPSRHTEIGRRSIGKLLIAAMMDTTGGEATSPEHNHRVLFRSTAQQLLRSGQRETYEFTHMHVINKTENST